MHKVVAIIALLSWSLSASGQSYAPAAGVTGTIAIPADSPLFKAWATGITVTRGPVMISDPSFMAAGSNFASSGQPGYAVGDPDGNSVSLGDGGSAILTFGIPIANGEGFDLAVFENGTPDFLELAFVEASSDGVHFFRFPCHSETQATSQIGTFGSPQPGYLNNLAGKYGGIYGTPFDLSELPDDPLLDKNNVTHIKVIDVVGSIDPAYARYDSYGNIVNDAYPTPFNSSGFDLQGVGVIHQSSLGINPEIITNVSVYPNPANDLLIIEGSDTMTVTFLTMNGQIMLKAANTANTHFDIANLPAGIYLVEILTGEKREVHKMIKQ